MTGPKARRERMTGRMPPSVIAMAKWNVPKGTRMCSQKKKKKKKMMMRMMIEKISPVPLSLQTLLAAVE
jgi:hypothetical protein